MRSKHPEFMCSKRPISPWRSVSLLALRWSAEHDMAEEAEATVRSGLVNFEHKIGHMTEVVHRIGQMIGQIGQLGHNFAGGKEPSWQPTMPCVPVVLAWWLACVLTWVLGLFGGCR